MRMAVLRSAARIAAALVVVSGHASYASDEEAGPGYQSDKHLAKAVTLHGLGVPFGEVLDRLSAATDVSLSAPQEVRETKVVVLVDNVAAAKVLEALVSTFGYRVRDREPKAPSGAEAKPRYEVLRPQVSREEEARLRSKDLQAFKERLKGWVAWGATPADQDQQFFSQHHEFDGDPLSLIGGTSTRAAPLGLFLSGLTTDQEAQLFAGGRVSRPLSELPPAARKGLLGFLSRELGIQTGLSRPSIGSPDPSDSHDIEGRIARIPSLPDESFRSCTVTLWLDTDLPRSEKAMYAHLEGVNLPPGSSQSSRPSGSPSSHLFRFGGRGAQPGSTSFSYVPLEPIKKSREIRRALAQVLDLPFGTKLPELMDWLPGQDNTKAARVLWALHLVCRTPIVADNHLALANEFGQPLGSTLGDAIDFYQAAMCSTWHPVGGISTFRSDQWYFEDALEPPATRIRAWREQAARDQQCSVDTLAQIAQLPNNAVRRLGSYGVLPGVSGVLGDPNQLAVLRLWGRLTGPQRQALQQRPAEVSRLPGPAREAIEDLALETGKTYLTAAATQDASGAIGLTLLDSANTPTEVTVYPLPFGSPSVRDDRPRCTELEWLTECPFDAAEKWRRARSTSKGRPGAPSAPSPESSPGRHRDPS